MLDSYSSGRRRKSNIGGKQQWTRSPSPMLRIDSKDIKRSKLDKTHGVVTRSRTNSMQIKHLNSEIGSGDESSKSDSPYFPPTKTTTLP